MGNERGIVCTFLKAGFKIFGNVIFGFQVFGRIPRPSLDLLKSLTPYQAAQATREPREYRRLALIYRHRTTG